MSLVNKHLYKEQYTSEQLNDYVASYFQVCNLTDESHKITICPDS